MQQPFFIAIVKNVYILFVKKTNNVKSETGRFPLNCILFLDLHGFKVTTLYNYLHKL